MSNFRNTCLLFLSALTIASCRSGDKTTPPDILAQNIDTTVTPGSDFFLYANGAWIKQNPIPPEESSWGIGQLVQREIYLTLRGICEKAAGENSPAGTPAQQIGDLWASGMDSAAIDKAGLSPLEPGFKMIDSISSPADIIKVSALLHRKGIDASFSDGIGQDDKNSNRMIYQLGQGGLGMPDRDYYFATDQRTGTVREAYKQYLYLTLLQVDKDPAKAKEDAAAIYGLETGLAAASRKLEELRDPNHNYNLMPLPQLLKLTPDIAWDHYLATYGAPKVDTMIVRQPEFFKALNKLLISTPLSIWKGYLKFHLLKTAAPYMDSTTFNNYFNYTRTMTGASQPRPRWKRVLDAENDMIGEALGRLFVQDHFPEAAKKRYTDLVDTIRSAYRDRINKLTWMSDSTKQKALYKLAHITKKVGYPDHWKDFSTLRIDRGPYILNMGRGAEWWIDYYIKKLGKPVDRTEWDMAPQTYNAYYNPSNNEIVLPAAAFFVPGREDAQLDDAFVYGYAGASTIGHEMTHGFDDQGRQYDAQGNLIDWWQPNDEKQFRERTAKIVRQFNEFNPVDTLHVNGEATQGENIADLGGVLLGLDAFKKTEAYHSGQKIGGLTPLQRYFLGYAYAWMEQQRKELLARQLKTDVHAPARERANAPMSNIPEFYDAFGIKPGDKMYRADSLKVSIW